MKSKIMLIFPVVIILIVTLGCGAGGKVSGSATETPQTSVLTPTIFPTETQITAPTQTAEPTQTAAPTGPCVNVFYPFVPGYQWIYQADDGDDTTNDAAKIGLTVSGVDGSQAKIDALDLSTGIITHTTAECADGAIQNYPMLTLGTLFGDLLTGDLKITYESGVFMPAETDLAAANWVATWTGDYKANGTFSATEDDEITTLVLNDSPVHMEWSLTGHEPVAVAAGTYADAYKVTRKASAAVSLNTEGMNVKAKLIVNTNQWYAAGVGLLKNVVDSASVEYQGITFPIEMKSRLELVEFRQGQ